MGHQTVCVGVNPLEGSFVFVCECGFRATAPINSITGPRPRILADGEGQHSWNVTADLLSPEEWRRFGVEPMPGVELGIGVARIEAGP